jgi:uncharacterized membrane protein YfcA
MEPTILRDILTLALGFVTGVMSAAFGVGGAVVSTPGIRALGAPALIAVGTTLPSILPSAITGTLRYARENLIRWDVVALVAPAGALCAIGGSLLSDVVPGDGHWLMILTATILGVTAYRMGTSAPDADAADTNGDRPDASVRSAHAVAIGVVGGLLSGLLGVGGGVFMVPAFAQVLGLSTKASVATSLVCVGLLALPGTITHALLGHIDWHLAALLALAVIPGARIGAALAIRSTNRRLRLTVALFLGVISVIYGVGELVALS